MKPIGRIARGSMPPNKFSNTSHEWIAAAVRSRFPKLAIALGEELFEAMLASYFAREPAARTSVRESGERLAGFLASIPGYPKWYAELAALDRAHVAVVHAPATIPLTRREVTYERPLRLIPAAALVELTTAADEMWAGRDAPRLASGSGTWIRGPRELDWPRTVLVWRTEGLSVRDRTVQPDEAAALRAASRGTTLTELYNYFGGPSPHARALDIVLTWVDAGTLAR